MSGMVRTHNLLDVDRTNPINWAWTPNRGMIGRWAGLPGYGGSPLSYDLVKQNNGTLNSTVSWTPSSRKGSYRCLSFTSGYVNIPNVPLFQNLGDGSISCWVNTTNAGASFRAVCIKENSFGLFMMDNAPGWYDWNGTGAHAYGSTINDGLWHHLMLTWQNGVASGAMLYLDGASVVTGQLTTASNSNPVRIGNSTTAGQEFAGLIDDVMIFNRYIQAVGVLNIYLDSQKGFPQGLNRVRRRPFARTSGGSSFIPGWAYGATSGVIVTGAY